MGFSWHFPRTRTSRRRLELAFYLVVAASLAGWALLDNVGLGQRSLAQRPLTAAPAALKSSTNRNATRPSGQKRFATPPIEQVQVGDRTLGENPQRDQVDESLPEPDPATWRKISLHLVKQSGHSLWVDFLRPAGWLEQNAVKVGGHIWLDLPEMGAVGNAEVLAVGPCPAIKPGKGHVVTGKFTHEADANIVRLRLEGQAEATGVTENHPYWSEDRHEFVPAGELREGERVNSAAGPVRVESISRAAYRGFVHNLEVHREHVYRVGRIAALVHNTCPGVLYHGTDIESAVYFLKGEQLDAALAAAKKIDGRPGFFLATDLEDAAFFGARRNGTVLEFRLSSVARSELRRCRARY